MRLYFKLSNIGFSPVFQLQPGVHSYTHPCHVYINTDAVSCQSDKFPLCQRLLVGPLSFSCASRCCITSPIQESYCFGGV